MIKNDASPHGHAQKLDLQAVARRAMAGRHLLPSGKALEDLLLKHREANEATFADFSLSVVKLFGRGEYDLELPGQPTEGHFGLALRDYTHSTAPNRRFPIS